MTSRRGKGELSDQDLDLWRRVAATAKPLKKRPAPKHAGPAEEEPPPRSVPARKPSAPKLAPPAKPAKAPAGKTRPKPPDLTHGTSAGLDKRRAVRLRKGLLPLEGRLDLHGLIQDEARARLDRFLAAAARQNKRCVLVITGKGRGAAGEGVLKTQVPRWLNEPHNRDLVVSFTHAQPKDGGAGALYVLLKRKRLEIDDS